MNKNTNYARREFFKKGSMAAAALLPASLAGATFDRNPVTATGSFNVSDFGAKGDGETLDGQALQAAIDACVRAGGGEVLFPPGRYLTTALFVRGDDVTLRLEEGAVLRASLDFSAYPPNHRRLLYVDRVRNFRMAGRGEIDLRGEEMTVENRLSWVIIFHECAGVDVRDIRITGSPNWTLVFRSCDNVTVTGVTIERGALINADGINLMSCRNVHISGCHIDTDDDAIVMKSRNEPLLRDSHNILIEDCVLASTSNALKIGTETRRDFFNITMRNCTIHAPSQGRRKRGISGIALISDDGGNLHNIVAENIRMTEVQAGFFIRINRRLRGDRDRPGTISNVVFDGITVESQTIASSIMGLPDFEGRPAVAGPGIQLRNLRLMSHAGGTLDDARRYPPERETNYPDAIHFGAFPAHGVYVRHARGVRLGPNVEFSSAVPDERPALKIEPTAEVDLIP